MTAPLLFFSDPEGSTGAGAKMLAGQNGSASSFCLKGVSAKIRLVDWGHGSTQQAVSQEDGSE